jgi:phenylacetate-CoA ligase
MIEAARTWLLLRRLRSQVRAPVETLAALQDDLLRQAVAHAAAHVPFYRRFWAEQGFRPASFRGRVDLERVPIVDAAAIKQAVRQGELLAQDCRPEACTHLDSSGSSGKTTRIWKGPREERLRRAVGLRIWFEHGFRWRDVTAQFQILPGPSLLLQKLGISRKTWISTAEPLAVQRAQFLAAGAEIVVGTPTALRAICHALREIAVRSARPRVVFAAGELLDAATRQLVGDVLGVPPVAIYGQTEVGYVAWQCERREGFHLNADTHLVETRGQDGPAAPGELGQLVITDLRCRTMPFLRYDTGDLAIAAYSACPCGRTLPTLASIEGRAGGVFTLASGALLTPRRLVDALAAVVAPEDYRIEQRAPGDFRMFFVDRVDEQTRAAALAILHELLGEVSLRATTVVSWPADGTGKSHPVSSAVPLTLKGVAP